MMVKKTGMVAVVAIVGVVGCKTVTVQSLPGSKVSCGDITGQATADIQVAVWDSWTGGKEVTVSKAGYASKKVPLKFNTASPVNVSLDRKFNITANQEGATIKVDGNVKGKTPAKGIAINENSESVVTVSMKGWLEAKIVVTPDTPTDIKLVMDQDGSGRRLLDLVPEQDGVRVKTTPIFSDTDVGENSPNVAQVRRLTNQPQTEFIQSISEEPECVGDTCSESRQCGVTHGVVVGDVHIDQDLIAEWHAQPQEMLAAHGDFTIQHIREPVDFHLYFLLV